jgi:hypothetical protein
LYSLHSVMSIGKFAIIDDGVLQLVRKIDRSVVINTFQSGKVFVLDPVPSESASLADNTDYDIWHAVLGPPFKANLTRKFYEAGYLILACLSNCTSNPFALSQSEHKAPS